jgi:hypothetical protein
MHIPQLLYALLCGPNIEVVEARLPESSGLRLVSQQTALLRVAPFAFGEQGAGCALLQHLHHSGGSSDLGLRKKQVDVFRHNDIADDHEPIALAGLFQDREESVAAPSRTEKRQSPIAGAGDKVEVMRPIRAMQTAGHNSPWYRQHRSRPCKKTQGRGTHCLETGNGEESEAWATRPPAYIIGGYELTKGGLNELDEVFVKDEDCQ